MPTSCSFDKLSTVVEMDGLFAGLAALVEKKTDPTPMALKLWINALRETTFDSLPFVQSSVLGSAI
jgi:hypothetical protein